MSVPTRRPLGNDTDDDNTDKTYYDTSDHVPGLQQPASPVYPQNLPNMPDTKRQNESIMPPPSLLQRPDPAGIRQKPQGKEKATTASQTPDANMPHQTDPKVPSSPFIGQQLTRKSSNQNSTYATGTPSYLGNQGNHHQTARRGIDGAEPTINGDNLYHAQMSPMDGFPQPRLGAPVFPAQYDKESPPYSALPNPTVDGPNATIRQPSENGWNSGPENAPPLSGGYEHAFQMMATSNDASGYFHDGATANDQFRCGEHGQRGTNTSLKSPRPRHDDSDAQYRAAWREAFENQQKGERDFREAQAQSAFLKAQRQRDTVQTYPQRHALPAQPNCGWNVSQEFFHRETMMGMTGDFQSMARNPSQQRSEANTPGKSTAAPFGMQTGQHEHYPTHVHDGRGFLSSHANAAPSSIVHASLKIDRESGLASLQQRPHRQASAASHIAPVPLNHPPVQQDNFDIAERQARFAPQRNIAQKPQTHLPTDRQGQLMSPNPAPRAPQIVLKPAKKAISKERQRHSLQTLDAFNRMPPQTISQSANRPQQPYVRLHHLHQMNPMIEYESTSLTDIGPPVTTASAEAWCHFVNEGGFGEDFEEIANLCHTIPIEGPPVMTLAADGGLEIQAGVWDHTNDWWSQQNVTDEWLVTQSSGDVTDEGVVCLSGEGRLLGKGVDLNGMQFEGEGTVGPSAGGSRAGGNYAGESLPDIPSAMGPIISEPSAIDLFAVGPFDGEPSTGRLNAGRSQVVGMTGGSEGKRKRVENGGDESQTGSEEKQRGAKRKSK